VRFSFDVGDAEQHAVDFYFNQWWGPLNIDVDGRRKVDDFRTYSLKLTKVYEFPIGTTEQHQVRIEMKRKLLCGGLRPYHYRVYVDNALVKELAGT
jgi:hypothetical protein